MKRYLSNRVWDWILCACMATGLVFHVYSGFVLDDPLSSNALYVALFMAVAMGVMLLASYSKKTVIAGIVIGAALLLAALAYGRAHGVLRSGSSGSFFIALSVTVLIAVLVWLACRTRAGTMVLLLAGNVIIAGSYLLQFPIKRWCFLLFLFSSIMMYWYRYYMLSMHQVKSGNVRIPRYMLQTFLVCLVAFALAGGTYYGVIRPLAPPTQKLKLYEVLKQMKIMSVTGVYTVTKIQDEDKRSSQTPETKTLNGNKDNNAEKEKKSGSGTNGNGSGGNETIKGGDKADQKPQVTMKQAAQKVYYNIHWWYIPWVWILLAAVIIAAFLFRYMLIRRWEKSIQSASFENQVINYYLFFIKGIQIAGYGRPESYTLPQYAVSMEHTLEEFADKEATFPFLTDIYIRTLYGKETVSEEEAALFERFYRKFRKALRKEMGVLKYLINLFRL